MLRGAAVAASEARTVHVRPGRLPSTETGLALCTDRPRAEHPGRSRRSELSGSGSAHSGQERDRLEFQLSLSLHDGSWPSVGPTGPSKDPESRGAMGWKLLLPSHGTADDPRYRSGDHSAGFSTSLRITVDCANLPLYNTFIHTKRPPDRRGRTSHLLGAEPHSSEEV